MQRSNPDQWSFTSRFFLVDGVTFPGRRLRYLSRFSLHIEMVNTRESPDMAGRMYPPIADIEYSEVNLEQDEKGDSESSSSSAEADGRDRMVSFEFSVAYKMDMKEAKKDIEVRTYRLSFIGYVDIRLTRSLAA